MAGGIKKTDIVEADLNQLSNELKIVGDEIGRIIDMSAKVKPIKGLGDLTKVTKETSDSAKKLDEVGKQLAATEVKLKQLTDERTQTIIKNRLAIQEATKAAKDKAIADRAEEGSLVRMRQKLRELTAEYDKTGKRTKAAADEIRKLSLSIQDAERATNRHQRNVGNYTDSLGKLGDKFSAMPGLLGNVGNSISSVSSKLVTLGPIGAIIGGSILAIGSPLAAFFTKTEQGVEMLERKTAGFKAAWNVLVGDLARGGREIIETFEDTSEKTTSFWTKFLGGINPAFLSLGVRMDMASTAAEKYTKIQQDLEDAERALIVPRAQANLKIKEAMMLYNDESKSLNQRMKGLKDAIDLENQTAQVEIDHQKQVVENIKIINAEKKAAGVLRDEDDKKLQEALARQIDLETESVGRQLRASKRLETGRKEILAKEVEEQKKHAKYLENVSKDYNDIQFQLAKDRQKEELDSQKEFEDEIIRIKKQAEEEQRQFTDDTIADSVALADEQKLKAQEVAQTDIIAARNKKNKIQKIQHELTLFMIDEDIKAQQRILDTYGLEADAYEAASKRIRQLRLQRGEEDLQNTEYTEQSKQQVLQETFQATAALLGKGLEFSQQIYAQQAVRAQETYDAEMNAAGDSLEAQTLAKRKFEAEDKKIKQRQAIASKLQAVLDASLALAMAIATTWKNPLLAALNIGAATLGLGMALATPIPQFAEGTENAPSSFIAGEEGSELIKTKSGKMILTPNKATLFSDNSLIGSTVFPHDQTQKMLANMAFNQVREVVDMRKTESALIGIEKNTRNKETRYTDSKGRTVVKRGNLISIQ